MNRLGVRLMLTYSLVSLLGIGGVLFSANVLVQESFRSMVSQRIETEIRQYASLLGQNWSEERGWDQESLDVLGMDALARGYIVKLITEPDQTVWDARVHNAGLCVAMLDHMAMTQRQAGTTGAFEERRVTVPYAGSSPALAIFGLYGPIFFNESETSFVATLNQWVLAIGAGALLFSLLLGALMASGIVRPLALVTETARQFRLGRWDSPLRPRTRIAEVLDLWKSIQALGQNLQSQQELRIRLGEDVSHELRTPLAIMQARLEAILDGVQAADPKTMESLHQEVLRLSRLVGQLEQLSHSEQAPPRSRPETLPSRDYLLDVLEPFRHEAELKGVVVSKKIEDFPLVADPDQTRQILINLLSNALRYTPEGGAVTLEARLENGVAVLCVRDTGVGILSKDLPFVFERFYRADASRNRATGGQGLGLAIAQSLARAQGGELSAQSQPGQGSVFTLTLPGPRSAE